MDSLGAVSTSSASSSTTSLPSLEELVRSRRRSQDLDTPPTDPGRPPATQGYDTRTEHESKQRERAQSSIARGLPSVIKQTPKILILDLDETLIHSKLRPAPRWNVLGPAPGAPLPTGSGGSSLLSFLGLGTRGRTAAPPVIQSHARLQHTTIEVTIDGRSVYYQVYKRPWVDYFLRKVASWYQVVVFTASMQSYADPVIDLLDGGHGLISGRLFRESCTVRNGRYLKDLTFVENDLSRVCLVDNSPVSFVLQESNGIPIETWTNDADDEALLDLLPVLDGLRYASDVRHILGLRGFL